MMASRKPSPEHRENMAARTVCQKGDGDIHDRSNKGRYMEKMEIRPITFKAACDFVNKNHRHHRATVGCKFCIGLYENEEVIGVAICGRPVARRLDDGRTCEINRLCTDGTRNACSMLYGACCRVAKEMGYKKVITYILESENGSS